MGRGVRVPALTWCPVVVRLTPRRRAGLRRTTGDPEWRRGEGQVRRRAARCGSAALFGSARPQCSGRQYGYLALTSGTASASGPRLMKAAPHLLRLARECGKLEL